MSTQAVADARSAIEEIVYGYAELMDRGDFAGVAALFSRAHYRGAGPSDSGVEGAAAVINPIIAGRYQDSYARDDSGWYLTERVFLTSLVGDLSAHLTVDPFSVA